MLGVSFVHNHARDRTADEGAAVRLECATCLSIRGYLTGTHSINSTTNMLGYVSTNYLLPLRLVIGFGFVAHGYAKLTRGPASFGAILMNLGLPQPFLIAWVTSLVEFFGGVSIMVGAFVAPVAVPLALIMLTALIKVHLQYGFSSIRLKGVTPSGAEFGPIGYEINLLYIAGLITLALSRPSRMSFDSWFEARKRSQNDSGRTVSSGMKR